MYDPFLEGPQIRPAPWWQNLLFLLWIFVVIAMCFVWADWVLGEVLP